MSRETKTFSEALVGCDKLSAEDGACIKKGNLNATYILNCFGIPQAVGFATLNWTLDQVRQSTHESGLANTLTVLEQASEAGVYSTARARIKALKVVDFPVPSDQVFKLNDIQLDVLSKTKTITFEQASQITNGYQARALKKLEFCCVKQDKVPFEEVLKISNDSQVEALRLFEQGFFSFDQILKITTDHQVSAAWTMLVTSEEALKISNDFQVRALRLFEQGFFSFDQILKITTDHQVSAAWTMLVTSEEALEVTTLKTYCMLDKESSLCDEAHNNFPDTSLLAGETAVCDGVVVGE